MAGGDQAKSRNFQAPKGTRDMYPQDLLRRRYIEKMWRDTSIRHGFEEIDGPTFEYLELYTAKSGEGIVSEIFGVFSGKDEGELAAIRAGGAAPYALRPEFTPTLARMYAAKAGSLPKPCKWFWQQNCFRAERPQRGRLREFGQWNCDVIGGESEPQAQAKADTDVVASCVSLLNSLGLDPGTAVARVGSRELASAALRIAGVGAARVHEALALLDRVEKMEAVEHERACAQLGFGMAAFRAEAAKLEESFNLGVSSGGEGEIPGNYAKYDFASMRALKAELDASGIFNWCKFDLSVARGLAYYTGMVFEVHEASGAERAIAGGGRYDNLIETFGGPPTPSVGFGMGDVVLSLVLQDRGLMPEGKDLLAALSAQAASLRPDVFVISNGTPEADAHVRPLVARLRRGEEAAAWLDKADKKPWDADRYAVAPLHARHSYKTTKNVGKLLQDATAAHARFAAIVENEREVTLRDLDKREEFKGVALDSVATKVCG